MLRRIHVMLDERELDSLEELWPKANRSEIIRAMVRFALDRERKRRAEGGED